MQKIPPLYQKNTCVLHNTKNNGQILYLKKISFGAVGRGGRVRLSPRA